MHTQVIALLEEHLAGMRAESPPECVFALDLDGLRRPEITFLTAWRLPADASTDTPPGDEGELVAMGSLKEPGSEVSPFVRRIDFTSQCKEQIALRKISSRKVLPHQCSDVQISPTTHRLRIKKRQRFDTTVRAVYRNAARSTESAGRSRARCGGPHAR
ncbi:MAG: hypothetical protein WEK74_13325, partial [Hydrogenophaga sp.]